MSVQPRYDYRDGRAPTLTGYELANIVEVTVRDLAKLGEVVDRTLAAGATSMDGLSFRVADPAPAEGRRGCWRWPPHGPGPTSSPRPRGSPSRASSISSRGVPARPPMPFAKAERMALAAADVATPVEGGSLEVDVTVTVTFRAR